LWYYSINTNIFKTEKLFNKKGDDLMAKKPRTAKQLANDERLRNKGKTDDDFTPTEVKEKKAAEEAKKTAETKGFQAPEVSDDAETAPAIEDKPSSPPLPATPQIDPNLIATIMATVQALQQTNPQVATATPEEKLDEINRITPSASVGVQGVQGVINKYPVEKSYYPDPTARLLDEPSLARFAMKQNYIFKWTVDGVEYERNGVAFSEPRFTLELFRRLYNEDGEATGSAALVARNMLHEDQMTTRVAAVRLNLVEKFGEGEDNMTEIMDEVRYWRMQQWLLDLFRPAKIETHRKRPTTQVIDGKVVEVFDTESLIDKASAQSQSSSLQSQAGVGGVDVPGV